MKITKTVLNAKRISELERGLEEKYRKKLETEKKILNISKELVDSLYIEIGDLLSEKDVVLEVVDVNVFFNIYTGEAESLISLQTKGWAEKPSNTMGKVQGEYYKDGYVMVFNIACERDVAKLILTHLKDSKHFDV